MTIEPFTTADIKPFLTLAHAEGWIAEPWEFTFLLDTFPQGCFVARDNSGGTTGYITSVCYGGSGWIGNLLVEERHRGKGIGTALFTNALDALRSNGGETVWLTASQAGTPLYEKYGFSAVDTIIRWTGNANQAHDVSSPPPDSGAHLAEEARTLDSRAWGDSRDALLEATLARGTLLQRHDGFMVCQPYGEAVQCGPFVAGDAATAESLFEGAMGRVAGRAKMFIDAPASNHAALQLFNRNNMEIVGSTVLMYSGKKPDYRPELLYGLATMGSCG